MSLREPQAARIDHLSSIRLDIFIIKRRAAFNMPQVSAAVKAALAD